MRPTTCGAAFTAANAAMIQGVDGGPGGRATRGLSGLASRRHGRRPVRVDRGFESSVGMQPAPTESNPPHVRAMGWFRRRELGTWRAGG